MQKVDFIKMHGLGNDFVIIDKRSNNITITGDIIKRLSDRRTGAGCDQLIPMLANNKADAVDIFNVFFPSPPVPHVSTQFSTFTLFDLFLKT